MYNVHSARPGKCQKSYTNKIVRNQFGVKFTLSTVVKTHINSNIPIVITGLFRHFLFSKVWPQMKLIVQIITQPIPSVKNASNQKKKNLGNLET